MAAGSLPIVSQSSHASNLMIRVARPDQFRGEAKMAIEKPLKPDHFPIEADGKKLRTNKGKPVASAESEEIADDLAERANEQADREEHDRWA
jgi:hypothetical protein